MSVGRMKWTALLLVCLLLIMAGCTAKSAVMSSENEEPNRISSEEYDENDTLLKIKEPEDQPAYEVDETPEESTGITEAEALERVLAVAMRIADQDGLAVDQTSVRILDQDADAFYVSVAFDPGDSGSDGRSDSYRVDRYSGDVSSLSGDPIPEVAAVSDEETEQEDRDDEEF